MIRTIIRNLIRFVFKHPFLAAMSALACIVIIVAVIGSGGNSPQPSETDNQPTTPRRQPVPQPAPDKGDDGVVPLTPGGGGGESHQPQHQKPTQPKQKNTPGIKKAAPDPYDDPDSPTHAEANAQIAAQPIIQKLPVSVDGITADLTDRTPSGQLVITVTYSGSLPKAKQTWKQLLRKYHDPGSYFVVFKK